MLYEINKKKKKKMLFFSETALLFSVGRVWYCSSSFHLSCNTRHIPWTRVALIWKNKNSPSFLIWYNPERPFKTMTAEYSKSAKRWNQPTFYIFLTTEWWDLKIKTICMQIDINKDTWQRFHTFIAKALMSYHRHNDVTTRYYDTS